MYEEVKIPHSEPMPIGIEEKIVYIKDLDEVSIPHIYIYFKDIKLVFILYYQSLTGNIAGSSSDVL